MGRWSGTSGRFRHRCLENYSVHPLKPSKLDHDVLCFVLFLVCFYLYVCECLLHNNMRMYTSNQYSYVRGPLRECRSIRPGASGLPYYCVPLVCVSEVIELPAVWQCNKSKTKNQKQNKKILCVVPREDVCFLSGSFLSVDRVSLQHLVCLCIVFHTSLLLKIPQETQSLKSRRLSFPSWVAGG